MSEPGVIRCFLSRQSVWYVNEFPKTNDDCQVCYCAQVNCDQSNGLVLPYVCNAAITMIACHKFSVFVSCHGNLHGLTTGEKLSTQWPHHRRSKHGFGTTLGLWYLVWHPNRSWWNLLTSRLGLSELKRNNLFQLQVIIQLFLLKKITWWYIHSMKLHYLKSQTTHRWQSQVEVRNWCKMLPSYLVWLLIVCQVHWKPNKRCKQWSTFAVMRKWP